MKMDELFENKMTSLKKETIRSILQPMILGALKATNNDHPGCIDANMYSSIVKRVVATLITEGGLQKMREILEIIEKEQIDAA
jgi:hypothetical protein